MQEVRFDREEGRIDRGSAGVEINPFCLNALEEALRYREAVGGSVTTVSMGPLNTESSLRDTLAVGADRAILLTDSRFAGADTWATAFTLASALRRLEGFDLIICGEKTVDGDTGQVGPELAEFLGIPHVAYVSNVVKMCSEELVVESEMFGHAFLKRMLLPGLITVTKDINEPRIPTLKMKMWARNAHVERWGYEELADVGKEDDFGYTGSKTKVRHVTVPPEVQREGMLFRGDPSEFIEMIVSQLEDRGFI